MEEDLLNDFHECYQSIWDDFMDYMKSFDPNLVIAVVSLVFLSFLSIIMLGIYFFCLKKSSKSDLKNSTTPDTVPSTPTMNRKSNAGLESFASAQAQRLSSKTMTPEMNDKKQKSPYSSLIDSGRTSLQYGDDTSVSSSSSDELSLPSNHKRSDLSHFRKTTLLPQAAPDANSKSQPEYNTILQLSIQKPEVLIGWKIDVPQYGRGVILDFQKKKFRSTKYRVLFDNQQEKLLKLKRSDKKGKIPFTFIEPMNGDLTENNK